MVREEEALIRPSITRRHRTCETCAGRGGRGEGGGGRGGGCMWGYGVMCGGARGCEGVRGGAWGCVGVRGGAWVVRGGVHEGVGG